MPLIVEVRRRGRWVAVGQPLGPGAKGSMSHRGPAGRQVYVFGCDGPCSLLLRSRGGVDVEQGESRMVGSIEGFEEVARLTPEDPTFECWLRPGRSLEPLRVRFSHR